MDYFTFKNYDWYCRKMNIKKSDTKSLDLFNKFCFNVDVFLGGKL